MARALLVPEIVVDGSSAAPSIQFASELTLGFYRYAAGIVGVSGGLRLVSDLLIDTAGLALDSESIVSVDTGKVAGFRFQTGGVNRWAVRKTNATETGVSNAGSNFQIKRYSDTGTLLDNPIDINRSTGVITFATAAAPLVGANVIWHAGNDGPGSGLDADTLDGVHAVNFPLDSLVVHNFGPESIAGAKTFMSDLIIGSRIYGTSLHNNASGMAGTTNQYIGSGTYTPTLTNTTNIASSTAYAAQYMRVGNVVSVSGKVDVDPTAAGAIELRISLPIASTFSADQNCSGSSVNSVGKSARMLGGSAITTARMLSATDVDDVNRGWQYHFTYLVM